MPIPALYGNAQRGQMPGVYSSTALPTVEDTVQLGLGEIGKGAARTLRSSPNQVQALAESMQKLVDMERTAFGMDVKDAGPGSDPLAQAVAGFTPARAAGALQALEQLRKQREAAAGAA